MKKVFFAFAIAGMFGFVACNNNNNAEENTDTMPEMEMVDTTAAVEAPVDTTAVEGAVEEATAETAEATENVAK